MSLVDTILPFNLRLKMGLALAAALALAGCERETILPGERFSVSDILDGGTGLDVTSDAPRAITLPNPVRLNSWSQRGYDALNRTPHASLGATLTPAWSAPIGQGNTRRHRISADPVAADGRVFTLDSRAGVVATSLASGAALWTADLQPGFDRGGNISGGGLAVSGGRLFVTTGFGELIALDAATGGIAWRQRLDAGIGAPTVADGTVYVVSRDNEGWAVDADTGRLDWNVPGTASGALLTGGAAPAITDRLVIMPFGSGEIGGVLRRSSAFLWNTSVAAGRNGVAYANINDVTSDPVVVGNRFYAGNQSGRVVAFDTARGERLWQADEGAYSPVLHTGGDLFFVSDRNELIRLDASTGARIWGTELPLYVNDRERRRRAVFTHFGPILAGGRLVMASGDGNIRFFSPESGALVGSVALRDGAATHPIVVDGTLLVVTGDGRLQAFR
ncbi:PQQ-like beta-propeller repeat protein [Jannaschia sp. CCS1]|uniref:PQQ-like beta-propeller repeat protein n=1 Tax=Jannaschia sp. (strain CCS1) TaxID=290400 RepID=UPI000053B97F|nr:PQQ-like beta-propeller repeat protein [Jannaschia sp. CCS1]ABD55116.1 Pyrrolo-quinoline quinone [Jannaschia sp. CCS1]